MLQYSRQIYSTPNHRNPQIIFSTFAIAFNVTHRDEHSTIVVGEFGHSAIGFSKFSICANVSLLPGILPDTLEHEWHWSAVEMGTMETQMRISESMVDGIIMTELRGTRYGSQ